jgi:two-component system, LytTR family, response regulator
MLKVLIVDDEFQGRNFLVRTLDKNFTDLTVVGQAANLQEANTIIDQQRPDVILLDIMLNQESGFDLLLRKERDFDVIFTTAHNEFAIKAFKFSALDYLLKPIDVDELAAALDRAKEKKQKQIPTTTEQLNHLLAMVKNSGKPIEKLAVPTTDGYTFIVIADIVYCESDGNYTHFFCVGDTKLVSSYTLKQYEEMLVQHGFFRAHKSYLVNLAHVVKYVRGDGGILCMSNGNEIDVSRRNKDALLKLLSLK